MITSEKSTCPKCDGCLKYYDKVQRIVRTKGRSTSYIEVRRFRCRECGAIHRELPEDVLPYKQYEFEVVMGVIEGLITPDTIGFEDYPCEMTMNRWCTQKIQVLL